MSYRARADRLDTGDRIYIYNARRRAPVAAVLKGRPLIIAGNAQLTTDRGQFTVPAGQEIDLAAPLRR